MKTMCLNALGGRLADRLLPYLKAAAPAVFCLQEVVATPTFHRSLLLEVESWRVGALQTVRRPYLAMAG